MSSKISSTMEDYLETIYRLKEKHGVARVRDIAQALHVKNSTVTTAVKTLGKALLVEHERYGYIQLTEKGEIIAKDIDRRHDLIQVFLKDILAVDAHQASLDACEMEHSMSAEAIKHLALFVEFIQDCPHADGSPVWLKNFKDYVKTGKRPVKKQGKAKK